jgi:hypothetical protein
MNNNPRLNKKYSLNSKHEKQVIYFETFDLTAIIKCILERGYFKSTLYYVDSPRIYQLLILPIFSLLGISVSKLDFRLIDIRDIKSRELVRERIVRKDLFQFEERIKNSKEMKNLKESNHSNYEYILKGITDLGILEKKSISRALFLTEVIKSKNISEEIPNSTLYIDRRTWMDVLIDPLKEHGITVIPVKKINFQFTLQEFPRTYLFLKYVFGLISKRNLSSEDNNLFMEGRGDLNFKNDGFHSDFSWLMNSEFPSLNVVVASKNKFLFDLFKAKNIQIPSQRLDLKSLIADFSNQKRYGGGYKNIELRKIKNLSKRYQSLKVYWKNYLNKNKVKIFLSWNKFDNTHMAISDAMHELGGVSCIHQIAYDGYRAIECRVKSDVSFIFSNLSSESVLCNFSESSYQVITGYTKDHSKPLLKNSALELRQKIISNGASKIITALDENNGYDMRWHTGAEWQQENYVKLIDQLFKDNSLGLIFKPKHGLTLRSRLGEEVYKYIEKAKKTGRCIVLDDSLEDSYLSSAPPMLAALSSDICIHGHFGTASMECALAGMPTLVVDREVSPSHNFYQYLKKDEVIFSNWDDAIYAGNEFLDSKSDNQEIGNWEKMLEALDPFCDGKGSFRMGSYLNYLKEGYELGMSKKQVLERALEIYSKKWGSDKIIQTEA